MFTMPNDNETNENNNISVGGDTNTNNNNTNTSSGCVYDKYGRSPDKKTICGIGLPSAPNDEGSGFTKSVFENKCPHCGQDKLKWAWNFGTTFEGSAEGGTAEGHFFCVSADGGCDADYSAQGHEHIQGSTYSMTRISGPTASTEEEAQQLINGQLPCDGSSSTGTTQTSSGGGGGAIKIPDMTFYGLIKQIIGATDGLFIVASNMAFLLSFQEMFKYRDMYDEHIPTIEPSNVINDTIKKNWSVGGYYNSVEVTYKDGILKYGHDTLIKQYGENTFYYDCPNDDYETAKSKAQALLTAHVRDYSTDIELQIFYNEHITAGSWVKLHKSLTQITGKTRKERQQEELSAKGKKIETKRKGLTITNISEEIVKKDNVNKKIHHLVDEKGEKIDIETEESDYDLFFVQGYSCRLDEHNSLIMNLHLKYGPDTPEDPINATIGTLSGGGGSSTSGSTGSTGSESIDAAVQSAIAGCQTNLDKAKAIDKAFKSHVFYDYYYDVHHPVLEEAWTNAHLNCADGANVLSAMFAAAGIEATIIHTSGHYIVKVTVDGQIYYTDNAANSGEHTSRPFGEVWGSTSGSEVGKKIGA